MSSPRPMIITVVCVVMLIGALLAVPMILSDAVRGIGAWYPPFVAFGSVSGLACTVGLWMMRRWAVYLYIASFAIGQVVLLVMGLWSISSLTFPAIFIALMLSQWSKMR